GIEAEILVAGAAQVADGDAGGDAGRPGGREAVAAKTVEVFADAQRGILREVFGHLGEFVAGKVAEVAALAAEIVENAALEALLQILDGARLTFRRAFPEVGKPFFVCAFRHYSVRD